MEIEGHTLLGYATSTLFRYLSTSLQTMQDMQETQYDIRWLERAESGAGAAKNVRVLSHFLLTQRTSTFHT